MKSEPSIYRKIFPFFAVILNFCSTKRLVISTEFLFLGSCDMQSPNELVVNLSFHIYQP